MPTLNLPVICAFLLTLTTSTVPLRAESSLTPLPGLKDWSGKYPFDKVAGKDLWATPGLREALIATMGPSEYQRLLNYARGGPSTPVDVWQSYVFVDVCKAHDCSDEHFNLIIETEAPKVYVCRATAAASARSVVVWSTAGIKNVESSEPCTIADEDSKHDAAYFKRFLKLIPPAIRAEP